MEKEFNLSEKICGQIPPYFEEVIKEFIKRLKEHLNDDESSYIIDKLAGKSLIEEKS